MNKKILFLIVAVAALGWLVWQTGFRALNIIVYEPRVNQSVGREFVLRGIARVFESQLNWEITNSSRTERFLSGSAMAAAPDAGKFGDFSLTIILPPDVKDGDPILLRVLDYSAKDGSEENLVEIPLRFSGKKIEAEIYFGNSALDPETDCQTVFPVKRTVSAEAPARPSLEMLFMGPSESEKEAGYFTSIPEGVKINSLRIESGIAYVDLSEELEKGVGGSCRVTAIRFQITKTLKQFPSISSVVISINGRVEDILQP
jgi:hypothetical protein